MRDYRDILVMTLLLEFLFIYQFNLYYLSTYHVLSARERLQRLHYFHLDLISSNFILSGRIFFNMYKLFRYKYSKMITQTEVVPFIFSQKEDWSQLKPIEVVFLRIITRPLLHVVPPSLPLSQLSSTYTILIHFEFSLPTIFRVLTPFQSRAPL